MKIAISTGETAKERDEAVQTIRDLMKRPAELQFRSSVGCADGTDCNVELYGSDFKEGAAQVEMGDLNSLMVRIVVKDKKKLADVSTKLIGQNLAIYLDNERISAPVVQQALTDGTAVITGQESREEAQNLRILSIWARCRSKLRRNTRKAWALR